MAASTRLHWPFYLALRTVLAWLLSTRVLAKADVMARTASRLLENDRRLHECMYVRVLELLASVRLLQPPPPCMHRPLTATFIWLAAHGAVPKNTEQTRADGEK